MEGSLFPVSTYEYGDRQIRTYWNFLWELWSCRWRRFRHWLCTPSLIAACIWIGYTVILALPGLVFFYRNYSLCLRPHKVTLLCYGDVTFLPTILAGIATLVFGLFVFIVEYMRARKLDQVSRGALRKSLLFPLTVVTVTAFCILALWHRGHNIFLASLPLAVGLITMTSAYRLLRRFWEEEQFDQSDLPVLDELEMLFLTEVQQVSRCGKASIFTIPQLRLQRLEQHANWELNSFVRSVVREDPATSENGLEYVRFFGKFLVYAQERLESYNFLPHRKITLHADIGGYLRQLIIQLPADMRCLQGWTAGYLPVLNAELAFAADNRESMQFNLETVVGLYWKKAVRDKITKNIWRYLNEDMGKPVESKLFEKGKAAPEYERLVPFVEIFFKVYQTLILAAYKEHDAKNFPKIIAAYSRCFSEFIIGGFQADFDVEQEGDNARWRLENQADKLSATEREQSESAVALDNVRRTIERSKHEMLLVSATKFFEDMVRTKDEEERKKIGFYVENTCSLLPTDIADLLGLVLRLSEDGREKWGWSLLNMPEDDEIEGIKSWVTGSAASASAGLILFLILTHSWKIPDDLLGQLDVAGRDQFRVREWIELLTKLQSAEPPGWSRFLTPEHRQRIPLLLAQLEKLKARASAEERREVRQKSALPDAGKKFKEAIMRGYRSEGGFRALLKGHGLHVYHQESKKYEGDAPAYGFHELRPKEGFFDEHWIKMSGENYGGSMARTEDRLLAKAIAEKIMPEGKSFDDLLAFLETITRQRNIIIVMDHWAILRKFSNSEDFTKRWTPKWQVPEQDIAKITLPNFEGFLTVGKRRFPLHSVRWGEELEECILVLKKGKVGDLTYLAPLANKEPLSDRSTAPLFIRSVVFSDEPKELEKALAKSEFMPDVSSADEKKLRALELMEIEILMRLVTNPDPDGIKLFRLSDVSKNSGDSPRIA